MVILSCADFSNVLSVNSFSDLTDLCSYSILRMKVSICSLILKGTMEISSLSCSFLISFPLSFFLVSPFLIKPMNVLRTL
jgi:hypothetical protein